VHFGNPTPEEKEAFTLVLRGMFSLPPSLPPSFQALSRKSPLALLTFTGRRPARLTPPPPSLPPSLPLPPGHIALARARFPEGILGAKLDILARLPLWSVGLDYRHGTGKQALLGSLPSPTLSLGQCFFDFFSLHTRIYIYIDI